MKNEKFSSLLHRRKLLLGFYFFCLFTWAKHKKRSIIYYSDHVPVQPKPLTLNHVPVQPKPYILNPRPCASTGRCIKWLLCSIALSSYGCRRYSCIHGTHTWLHTRCYTCTLQMGGSADPYAVVTLTSTALPLSHREPLASIVNKRTSTLVLCVHTL